MHGKKRLRREDDSWTLDGCGSGRTVFYADDNNEEKDQQGDLGLGAGGSQNRWPPPANHVVLSERDYVARPIDFGYTLKQHHQQHHHQQQYQQHHHHQQQHHQQQQQQQQQHQQQLHQHQQHRRQQHRQQQHNQHRHVKHPQQRGGEVHGSLLGLSRRQYRVLALDYLDKVLGWSVKQLCQEDEEASIDELGTRMALRPAAFALDVAAADVDSAWRYFLAYWGKFAMEETRACLRAAIEDVRTRRALPGPITGCKIAGHQEQEQTPTVVIKLRLPRGYVKDDTHQHVGACFLLHASDGGSRDQRIDGAVLGIVTQKAKQFEEREVNKWETERREAERQGRRPPQPRGSFLFLSVHDDAIPLFEALFSPRARAKRSAELELSVSHLSGLINFHRMYGACCKHPPPPPPFADYLLGRRVGGQEEDAADGEGGTAATLAALAAINHPHSQPSAQLVDYVIRVFAHGRCAGGFFDAAHARQHVVSLFAQVKAHGALASFAWHAEEPPRLISQVAADNTGLNEAQRQAFARCLGRVLTLPSSLSCVQGPPGTGKTHFFARLALTLVAQAAAARAEKLRIRRVCSNFSRKRRHDDESDDEAAAGGVGDEQRRVLCCGPSNKSVVVAVEAFLKLLDSGSGSGSGRGGAPRVVVTGVEERLRSGMDDDDGNDGDGSFLRPLLALLQTADALAPSELLRRLQRPQSLLDVLPLHAYNRFLGSVTHLRRAVVASEGSRSSVVQLRREVHAVMSLAEFFGVTRVGNFDDDDDEDDEGRNFTSRCVDLIIARDLREIESRVRSLIPANKHALQRLFDETLRRLEDDVVRQKAADHLLQCSHIVFSTLSSSGSPNFMNLRSHVLLLDEAAMAHEAQLLVGLKQQPQHLVLVGDPQQLGCFVESKHARAQRADSSAMSRLMLECGLDSSMLQTQYRMHPEICSFPNQSFYAGRLENDGSVTEGQFRSAPWAGTNVPHSLRRPYVFVHTDGQEETEPGGMSLINTHECETVVRILTDLLPLPHAPGAQQRARPKKVIVVSFYLAQVKLLQRRLAELGGAFASVRVCTVDSVQGSEADVVLLSFVRSNLTGNVGFLKNYRRLNVALTRAKAWLLCVGNFNTLRRCRFWQSEPGVQAEAAVVSALASMAMDAHNRGICVNTTFPLENGSAGN